MSYDQRGAGLSYFATVPRNTMALAQFAEDAHVVRQAVFDHLGRSNDNAVYVMGHSMGTVIGQDLVKKYPQKYKAYIGVGQVVAVVENEQGSYDYALAQARPTRIKRTSGAQATPFRRTCWPRSTLTRSPGRTGSSGSR